MFHIRFILRSLVEILTISELGDLMDIDAKKKKILIVFFRIYKQSKVPYLELFIEILDGLRQIWAEKVNVTSKLD